MRHQQAKDIADGFVELLRSSCEQIIIAGSLRRMKPEVKDIEIVAVPKIETLEDSSFNLFGDTRKQSNDLLAARIGGLVARATLRLDTVIRRNGPRYKRFMSDEGIAIELFIADANASNFGNILAIRTGNADFSRALVKPRWQGGLMPGNMKQKDGYLWRVRRSGDELIPCPTEEAFFDTLGVPWIEPIRRCAEQINAARDTAMRERER